jgi:hypothetical protein
MGLSIMNCTPEPSDEDPTVQTNKSSSPKISDMKWKPFDLDPTADITMVVSAPLFFFNEVVVDCLYIC